MKKYKKKKQYFFHCPKSVPIFFLSFRFRRCIRRFFTSYSYAVLYSWVLPNIWVWHSNSFYTPPISKERKKNMIKIMVFLDAYVSGYLMWDICWHIQLHVSISRRVICRLRSNAIIFKFTMKHSNCESLVTIVTVLSLFSCTISKIYQR